MMLISDRITRKANLNTTGGETRSQTPERRLKIVTHAGRTTTRTTTIITKTLTKGSQQTKIQTTGERPEAPAEPVRTPGTATSPPSRSGTHRRTLTTRNPPSKFFFPLPRPSSKSKPRPANRGTYRNQEETYPSREEYHNERDDYDRPPNESFNKKGYNNDRNYNQGSERTQGKRVSDRFQDEDFSKNHHEDYYKGTYRVKQT